MDSLNSSDNDLDAAAQISLADIEQAKQTARRHGAGTELVSMLEAKEVADDAETPAI